MLLQGHLKNTIKNSNLPTQHPNDFRRVAERMSNIQLKWYLTDWTQTTNRIDYSIDS